MGNVHHIIKSQGTIIGEVQSLTIPHKIIKQENNFTFKATSLIIKTENLITPYFQLWTQQNGADLYYFKNCQVISIGTPSYTRNEYTTYHNVIIKCETVYTGKMLKFKAFW